jgi:CHAD domain-containing protein
MAYRFKLDESLEKGSRRIALNQIEIALANINSDGLSAQNIHECRKALKRTRALIKVLAPAAGEKSARVLDRRIRDAGRLLSCSRDRTVLLDTISALSKTADAPLAAALTVLTAALTLAPVTWPETGPETGSETGPETEAETGDATAQNEFMLDDVRGQLEAARQYFEKLTLEQRGVVALKAGLVRSYKDGKKALKTAYKKRNADSFHDLRKAVQLHWRQMSLLSRAWPEEMALRVAAAREISQILGEEHDLELLDQASKVLDGADSAARDVIRMACKERRKALRQRARYRAERLYAEDAGAFAARVVASWRAAQKIEAGLSETASAAGAVPGAVVAAVAAAGVPRIAAKGSRQIPARKAG